MVVQPVIVTSVNQAYGLALAAMLKSMELNLHASCNPTVYIFCGDISEKWRARIQEILPNDRINVNWVHVNTADLSDLKISEHIETETYFRLLMEKLLPQHDSIIYLDADIILNSSVDYLWNQINEEDYLLAVPHASRKSGFFDGERGLPSYKVLGLPPKTRMFNAGVMVINLGLWREYNVSDRVLEYLRKYKDYVLWWDQDGLNAVLHGMWKELPATWNVMTSHLKEFDTYKDSLLSKEDFELVKNNPDIIHYSGAMKPWIPGYQGPFLENFWEYVRTLPQKNVMDLISGKL